MGVVNVTPDSFSDGGANAEAGRAIEVGLAMLADGAAIIDVGGESTRPGSSPIGAEVEQRRILPVVRALARAGALVSVDTRNAATMAAAVAEGAAIINDVSGLAHDPDAAVLVARLGCPVILMHMRGTPETMGGLAQYDDVAAEVAAELATKVAHAQGAGIARAAIAVDPGLGFAKVGLQNAALLRGLPAVAALGLPIVVGASRKRFIGGIAGMERAADRDPGSLAAHLFALGRGASVLRVHDVAGTVQAVRVWQALAA